MNSTTNATTNATTALGYAALVLDRACPGNTPERIRAATNAHLSPIQLVLTAWLVVAVLSIGPLLVLRMERALLHFFKKLLKLILKLVLKLIPGERGERAGATGKAKEGGWNGIEADTDVVAGNVAEKVHEVVGFAGEAGSSSAAAAASAAATTTTP